MYNQRNNSGYNNQGNYQNNNQGNYNYQNQNYQNQNYQNQNFQQQHEYNEMAQHFIDCDLKDEKAFLSELTGQVMPKSEAEKLYYTDPRGGIVLSKAGVDFAKKMLSERNILFIEKQMLHYPNMNRPETHMICQVLSERVEIVDGKRSVKSSAFGVSEQCRYFSLQKKNENPHYIAALSMKAARNSILKLLTWQEKNEVIEYAKEQEKKNIQ